MKYPFSYKVTYYDEISEKEKRECGISFADSCTDATKIIEDEYKETLISIDRIYRINRAKRDCLDNDLF